MRGRVCILTPGPLGSDPRVVKEADALAEVGHEVTTISTRTLSQVDTRDEAVLTSASWTAERLDFRARGNAWRCRRAMQVSQGLAFLLTRQVWLANRAISPFTASLVSAARKVAADLFIAHYPAALPAAAAAARLHKAHYSYDAEDFHPGDSPDGAKYKTNRRLVRAIEERHLPGCAYVTAASPGIADAYADAYGISRPTVLLNVFPRAQAPAAPTPAGTATPGPSVYWFSQTIGPDRGLEVAVEAVGRAHTRPHLYLRGSPDKGFVDKLRSLAARVSAAERLHILLPESPTAMVRLAAAYDVGLSGEPGNTRNNKIALGNKIFTYLLAGVPILISDTSAHRAFAIEAGDVARLYLSENVESLAAVIDELVGNPRELARARAAAFQLAHRRFNWDLERVSLLRCVEAAITCLNATCVSPCDELELSAGLNANISPLRSRQVDSSNILPRGESR